MHNSTALAPARPDVADSAMLNRLVMEAIACRKALVATYNSTVSKLAPHVLYSRAGELYVAAIVLLRNDQPPREPKLGIFKVTGLSGVALTNDGFGVSGLYDPKDERFAGTTVFSVE